MRLQLPNRKALTLLAFGLISLIAWYAIYINDTDSSWVSFAQKLALLGVGGLMTIVGINFTWRSMQVPPGDAPPKKSNL